MAKCEIIAYDIPVYPGAAISSSKVQRQCTTHSQILDDFWPLGAQCPIGRMEDIEARITNMENWLAGDGFRPWLK